jgi:hypothetical protein
VLKAFGSLLSVVGLGCNKKSLKNSVEPRLQNEKLVDVRGEIQVKGSAESRVIVCRRSVGESSSAEVGLL